MSKTISQEANIGPRKQADRFGNPIDPIVGFARGRILASSIDEAKRLRRGQALAADRVRRNGPESVGVFTGNQRNFPVRADDLKTSCEEWVGPGLFAEELRATAIAHMGGRDTDAVAVFNRTSAGIVATIAALARGRPIVSIVPSGGRSHASVVRGCGLARVELIEAQSDADWRRALEQATPHLVVITTVTSSLERLDDVVTHEVASAAHLRNAIVFLDEAYGVRLRPILHGGKLPFALGADIAITNCDKAGLSGPRAGVLLGRADLVTAASAKGSEFGMEARAPIAAGALRSLQGFSAADLRKEADAGQKLAVELGAKLGNGVVKRSDLGPMVHEDDVLDVILKRAGLQASPVVPAEAAAALGMLLLRDHGILTVNTHGQPGARVSLRLKPTLNALERVGGNAKVVAAIDQSLNDLSQIIANETAVRQLILGAS
jgi:L-seryl-tRNA(Ser) seleniumtransferase